MDGRNAGTRAFCLVVAALLVAMSGSPSMGAAITLTDLNTTIHVNPDSNAGIDSWKVNGVEHMSCEWFWYRVGDAGPTNPELSVDTLSLTLNNPLDGNENLGNDYLSQKFVKSGQFSVSMTYSLTGGEIGTGNSDLGLLIKIVNTGAQSLNFHFFQMTDFDLAGTSNGDTAQVINANKIEQWKGSAISSVIANPSPTLTQVDSRANIYGLLANSQGDDLNGTAGPTGPGNMAWAYQWNVTLAPGANLLISEDQLLNVPEPASLTLLAIGALALLRRRK